MKKWFKPIPFLENYGISPLGSIKNFKTGRILKPYHNAGPYLKVDLRSQNAGQEYVHRLVGFTYLKLTKEMTIDHKNKDTHNNTIFNLEVCSLAENIRRK